MSQILTYTGKHFDHQRLMDQLVIEHRRKAA
ncbi:hypothetical protein AB7M29_002659 [Pseudomonas sp. F-14 TE3623]